MSDTTNTDPQTPAQEAPATETPAAVPAKPESWAEEAWHLLVDAEKWLVADLHDLGLIFAHDIWPAIKLFFSVLFSQDVQAAVNAVTGNIADPTLIPAAVASAVMVTTTTNLGQDAVKAIQSAQAAIVADPKTAALFPNLKAE